jgi:hypothetical protein
MLPSLPSKSEQSGTPASATTTILPFDWYPCGFVGVKYAFGNAFALFGAVTGASNVKTGLPPELKTTGASRFPLLVSES